MNGILHKVCQKMCVCTGASRFQGMTGNGQPDASVSDANGSTSEVRHPHLQKLADHVPFVHHGSRS